MPRSRPISLNVMPDVEASNTAHTVLQAYTAAIGAGAFNAAVRAWLRLHPNARPEDGTAAVAKILCHKM